MSSWFEDDDIDFGIDSQTPHHNKTVWTDDVQHNVQEVCEDGWCSSKLGQMMLLGLTIVLFVLLILLIVSAIFR
jgi:hypothetical protein